MHVKVGPGLGQGVEAVNELNELFAEMVGLAPDEAQAGEWLARYCRILEVLAHALVEANVTVSPAK